MVTREELVSRLEALKKAQEAFIARLHGIAGAIAETEQWLSKPEKGKDNGKDLGEHARPDARFPEQVGPDGCPDDGASQSGDAHDRAGTVHLRRQDSPS